MYQNGKNTVRKQSLLQRPRINQLLSEAIKSPLVTVVAGAGYGKTQAVSMFVEQAGVRCAWLALSILDNNEECFWKKLTSCVFAQDSDSATHIEQPDFPVDFPGFRQFVHLFAKEVYKGSQFVLVLDDFHLITNEAIRHFIESLICSKLENICILLISRAAVDLNVSGVYSGNLLRQITTEELCFTMDESEEYLKQQGLSILQRELEQIQTVTDGWPFALYLVSLSLKKSTSISSNTLAGALPLIFEMLEREIFSAYAPDIQKALVKISLLDSFPAGLIKELFYEDFKPILQVIDSNHFIRYDPHTECYLFHHMFLEFLSRKQLYLDDEEVKRIYAAAAKWYLAHRQSMAALACYQKSGRYDEIWDIIFHMQPERRPKYVTDILIGLLDELPAEMIKSNPLIRVMRASFLLNNLKLEAAKQDMLQLIEEMKALPPSPENRAVIGEAYIILSYIHLTLRDYSFIDDNKMAEEYLPDGSIFNYSKIRIIDSNDSILPLSPEKKDIDDMLAALFETVPRIAKVTHGLAQGAEYLAAAEIAYYRGDLRAAEKQAFESLYRAKEMEQADIACCALFIVVALSFAKGDYKACADYLNQLREYAKSVPGREFLSMYDIAESWFHIKIGKPHKTAGWIMNDTLNGKMHSPISVGRDRLIRALCFLEDGKHYELLAFTAQLEDLYDRKGLLFGYLYVNVLKIIAHYELGNKEWLESLERSYELSIQSGCIMQFVEMGSYTRKIIDKAKSLGGHAIPKEWLDSLYAKISTYTKHQAYLKTEFEKESQYQTPKDFGLSKREKEVLRYLYQGLTREEIADSLYISVGTVKNVLNSVYSKLGALNGVDAIRIAVQTKLL